MLRHATSNVSPRGPGRRPARARRRSGTAVVEFALAIPVLAFLTIGMFELSRGIQVKQILSDAARKACRTGIKPAKANSDIKSEITDILTDNGIDATKATVTIAVNGSTSTDASSAGQNDKISVKVSIPVSQIYWAGTIFLSAATVESETIVMMRQA